MFSGIVSAVIFFLCFWGIIEGSIFMLENFTAIQEEIWLTVKFNTHRATPTGQDKFKNFLRFVALFVWYIATLALTLLSAVFMIALIWFMADRVVAILKNIFGR